MDTTIIRQQLHAYIENANEKKIKGLYMFIEDEMDIPFALSDEQLNLLDKEREDHLNSRNQSYNWEEAKQIICGKQIS